MNLRTVVWVAQADNELGSIWVGTGRRRRVTEASYEIDRDLREDAEHHGTPLSEGLLVIERQPLRAVFEISEDDRLVTVLSLAMVSK